MSDSGRELQFIRMRQAAREIFLRALAEASIGKGFARHVNCERGILRVREDLYVTCTLTRACWWYRWARRGTRWPKLCRLKLEVRWKASLPARLSQRRRFTAFAIFVADIPRRMRNRFSAASAILRLLEAQPASALVVFLLSGGGSSIVEKPIDDEISCSTILCETYRALVLSGAPIAEINTVRKHLSAVKGGRLAQAAFPATQVSLLVSDVPDGTPDALASGPTMPDSTTVEDCYRVAEKYELLRQFPASTRELFERHAFDETPKSDDPAFHRARWWPVLSNQTAIEEASVAAERAGFIVHVDNSCDDWDYEKAADYLVGRLRELRKQFSPVCLISGGEVTVKVTNGGVGGRNQQIALGCAAKIVGKNITVLSAGTDGVDGNSSVAGAVADGTTLDRARSRGLDLREAA